MAKVVREKIIQSDGMEQKYTTYDDGRTVVENYNAYGDKTDTQVIYGATGGIDERKRREQQEEEERREAARERNRQAAIKRQEERQKEEKQQKADEREYNLSQARLDAKRRYKKESPLRKAVDFTKYKKIDKMNNPDQINSLFVTKEAAKKAVQQIKEEEKVANMSYRERKEYEEKQQALEDAKTNAKMRYRSQNPIKRVLTKKQYEKMENMTSVSQVDHTFRSK